jgi:phospholipase C
MHRGLMDRSRRTFLKTAGAASVASAFSLSIERALAVAAGGASGSIADVQHVVILVQENRSFDHYFGTFRGARGFLDRHPAPTVNGNVWHQSDGGSIVAPFHLDSTTTSGLKLDSLPHEYGDAQAAWGQGRLDHWPLYKNWLSMGYYRRADIPFQFALAEAFTLCDAYHCSVTGGTDPNRIVLWSGSNFDPQQLRRGEDCTDADAEPVNFRCVVKGALPTPGYSYQGSPFRWPTIPEVLERSGVSWRIYQDPNNNWSGVMHGGLAFAGFRNARPGSPIYERGMRAGWVDALAEDVRAGHLPEVSWILPSQSWSEHPAGSSPMQGAEFTSSVLDALTAEPEIWSRTVLFVTFDENDGQFDHVPPPAPPSYDQTGQLAGGATLPLSGLYFSDPARTYRHPHDPFNGTLRPWGLGPRVPMYVVSPWSRGGWVNSQVFDHTSLGRFLEKRWGLTIPAISPWHRSVCGDLTSCFDFSRRDSARRPKLPAVGVGSRLAAAALTKPPPRLPPTLESLFQERGARPSRGLPYVLRVDARNAATGSRLILTFRNEGDAGAVFHVYNRLDLRSVPRRYTVESNRTLEDIWELGQDRGRYDLWVYGPNGFVREFVGYFEGEAAVSADLRYEVSTRSLRLVIANPGPIPLDFAISQSTYRRSTLQNERVPAQHVVERRLALHRDHLWYDLTVETLDYARRFAGRMETGRDDVSDPAI